MLRPKPLEHQIPVSDQFHLLAASLLGRPDRAVKAQRSLFLSGPSSDAKHQVMPVMQSLALRIYDVGTSLEAAALFDEAARRFFQGMINAQQILSSDQLDEGIFFRAMIESSFMITAKPSYAPMIADPRYTIFTCCPQINRVDDLFENSTSRRTSSFTRLLRKVFSY